MTLLDVCHQAASMAVFYTCFCRFVRMDASTRPAIRASFWLLSLASIACMVGPAFGWGRPNWLMVLLLAAIGSTQAATARHWRCGPPRSFQKPDDQPTTR
jgi:hypothetical protein